MKYTSKHAGHSGDVQFFSIDELPEGLVKVNNQPVAFGETSGHIHVITGDVELLQDPKTQDFYVKTGKGKSFAQHCLDKMMSEEKYSSEEVLPKADHLPCELLPNTIYKIGIHKKYDPFEKVWNKVRD